MPALDFGDIMALIGPFSPSWLFVILLTLAPTIPLLSAQSATAADHCYARQYIASREVTRNSDTLVMELVVKDVGSCIKKCCEQRAKGGCEAISFDHTTSSCAIFRCSAYIACLPMNVKNSVNSYLFFTIPVTSTTTPLPLLTSSTGGALATPVADPLSPFPILSCPRDYAHEDVALAGKFIREVLLHDAITCLSFCCRHSHETGCHSVSFRSDAFRCTMFRCVDENDCKPTKEAGVVSFFIDKKRRSQVKPSDDTDMSMTYLSFHNRDNASTKAATDNGLDKSASSSMHNDMRSSTRQTSMGQVLIGTTAEQSSRVLGNEANTGPATNQHQKDYMQPASTTVANAATTETNQLRSTTTTAESAHLTYSRSLTAEVEKLAKQEVVDGSTESAAVAQTDVSTARATAFAPASADPATRPTASFTNDEPSLARRQITSQRPTDATDGASTKNTDPAMAHSDGKYDQRTEAVVDQSSSLLAVSAHTEATFDPAPSIATAPGLEPAGAPSDSNASTDATLLAQQNQMSISNSEATTDIATAETMTQFSQELPPRTTSSFHLEQGAMVLRSQERLPPYLSEYSYATVIVTKLNKISTTSFYNFVSTSINQDDRIPMESVANDIVPSMEIPSATAKLTSDATQSFSALVTTSTHRFSEQQPTLAVTSQNWTAREILNRESNEEQRTAQTDNYLENAVGVSMDSHDHLDSVSIPIWALSIMLAFLIALLTIMVLIAFRTLRRLMHRSREYDLLKA